MKAYLASREIDSIRATGAMEKFISSLFGNTTNAGAASTADGTSAGAGAGVEAEAASSLPRLPIGFGGTYSLRSFFVLLSHVCSQPCLSRVRTLMYVICYPSPPMRHHPLLLFCRHRSS